MLAARRYGSQYNNYNTKKMCSMARPTHGGVNQTARGTHTATWQQNVDQTRCDSMGQTDATLAIASEDLAQAKPNVAIPPHTHTHIHTPPPYTPTFHPNHLIHLPPAYHALGRCDHDGQVCIEGHLPILRERLEQGGRGGGHGSSSLHLPVRQ